MKKKLILLTTVLAMAGISACDDSNPVSQCINGEQRCESNAIEICTNNTWTVETSCEGATLCNATSFTCETNACSPNDSKRCNGKAVEACTDGAWNVQTHCNASETCNDTSFICETAAACTNDSKRCNGKAIEVCANGAWTIETQCNAPETCLADTFTCEATTVTCSESTTRCTNTGKLETCHDNSWSISDCGAEKTCPTGKTACETTICNNGEIVCNASNNGLKTCVDNAWIETACAAPTAICNANQCVACLNGDKRCESNAVELCVGNVWTTQKACASQTCDAATYTCITVDCQAGWKRCNGNTVEVCNAANKYEPASPTACATNSFCLGNTSAHTTACVACKNDSQCTSVGLPVCHSNNTCVACHAYTDQKCDASNGRLLICTSFGDYSKETKCGAGKRCEAGNNVCTAIVGYCSNSTDCTDPLFATCFNQGCVCTSEQITCKTIDGKAKLERCYNNIWNEYSDCEASEPVCNGANTKCVQCTNNTHCGENSACDVASNTCKSTLPVSTLTQCEGMAFDDSHLTGVGVIEDSREIEDPNTITAKFLCGKAGQKLSQYVATVGKYSGEDFGAFAYRAKPRLISGETYLCLWSYQLPGEQPMACGKNDVAITDFSTIPTTTVALSISPNWDYVVDFENFKAVASYTNTQTVVEGNITVHHTGMIAGEGSNGSFSGNTLVFGNHQDQQVTVVNAEPSAYIYRLDFNYLSWETDTFNDGQILEIFLDEADSPFFSFELKGVYNHLDVVSLTIKNPVKSFKIQKRKTGTGTAAPPRLRIDNIRWTTHN